MRAQILTGRSRHADGDDAQQAAGVTEEPPGLGLEYVRDGRDSFSSSRTVSMTAVPRTPTGREDRRRWTPAPGLLPNSRPRGQHPARQYREVADLARELAVS